MNQHQSANILIVDDNPDNLRVLASMLGDEGYFVRPAIDGPTALIAAEDKRPDMVLLDINMPDMNGYEVSQRLKQQPDMQDVPIIFISALDDVGSKVRAFEHGGVDYVSKPFQFAEVAARVSTHLTLYFQKRDIERLNTRYQDLFDNANDLIQSVDETGNYIYVNRYWCQALGYTRQEALGMNMSQVIHPAYLDKCQAIVKKMYMVSGSLNQVEVIFLNRDGEEIIVEGNISSQQDIEYGFHCRGIFRDITERRRAEKQTIELTIERERMRLLNEFIERTSHDLRTPLAVIRQQPFFLRRTQDADKQEARLRLIEEQVDKLDVSLRKIHELVRLEHTTTIQIEPVSLREIIDDVLVKIGDVPQVITVEHIANDLLVHGNLELIELALREIIDNAVLYTPAGTRITIGTGCESGRIHHIDIEDDGPGIEQTTLSRIFEPLYKGNSARTADRSSSGLGLAIAYRIMQLHGGDITATSYVGTGTRFRLIFG